VSNDRAPSQLLTSPLLPLNDKSDSCVFLCIGCIEVVKILRELLRSYLTKTRLVILAPPSC
jgi:hypothetical protein